MLVLLFQLPKMMRLRDAIWRLWNKF